MADEYKEVAETKEDGISKKKKIIIGVVVAVVVVAVIVVVCALTLGGDKEEYKDTLVSGETTSELKPGIENGVFVDGDQSANNNSSGNSAQNSAGGSSSSGSSGSAPSGSSSNSSSSGNSGSSEGSGSSSNSGSSDNNSNEDVARQLNISITMPDDGGAADKLFVYVNGELQNKDGSDVKIDGGVFKYKTSESYKGEVTVEAKLQNYDSHAECKVIKNVENVEFSLPLDSSEENRVPGI